MNRAKDLLTTVRAHGIRSAQSVVGFVRAKLTAGARDESLEHEVLEAWTELRDHPALQWVPPMWRPQVEAPARPVELDKFIVRAVERNLVVDFVNKSGTGMCVRVSTSPLQDRRVGVGVDPTTPAVVVDANLDAAAPTFEEAIVELRNVVVDRYGRAPAAMKSVGDAQRRPGKKVTRLLHSAR